MPFADLTIRVRVCLSFRILGIVIPIATYNVIRALVRAWLQRLPMGAAVENAVARSFISYIPAQYIQAILPSTIDTYLRWAASAGDVPRVQILDDEETHLLWLEPKGAEKIGKLNLSSCAGGGYVMPLSDGHLDWMNYTLKKCNEAGLNVSVAILEYDLVPGQRYPRQMIQAIGAFKAVLACGCTPGDVIIGGDSAGGHLALSLLSHLHNPRPEVDLSISLNTHLRGCFVVSPLLSLNSLTTRSYRQRFNVDSLSYKTIREWGNYLIDHSPWREEVSQGLGWGMALDVPESWWQNLNIVDHILVTGGHEELFRDHIVQFVDLLKRKSAVDLTTYIALDEAHDGPLMDFRAHRQPRTSTNTVTEWVISTFSNN